MQADQRPRLGQRGGRQYNWRMNAKQPKIAVAAGIERARKFPLIELITQYC
jgi:hypothetical protein